MLILLLELIVNLLDINLKLLKALVFPLKVALKFSKLVLPHLINLEEFLIIVSPGILELLLKLCELRLFQDRVFDLEIQNVCNVP